MVLLGVSVRVRVRVRVTLTLASQYGQTELNRGMVLLGVSVASLLLLYMDSLMN